MILMIPVAQLGFSLVIRLVHSFTTSRCWFKPDTEPLIFFIK